jgi:diguanylate cyclase (GGDEF)-like protein
MKQSELSKVDTDSLSFGCQEQLLILQRNTLESVSIDNNYEEQLQNLCYAAEAMLPNAVASIMLFNDDKSEMFVRCAPSLPEDAIQQLNGLTPGPHSGSCGTAVYCETAVYVEDTHSDPRWKDTKQFAIDFNVQACWSNPIHQNGGIIGSFALSSFTRRKPDSFQQNLLKVCAHLTSVILLRQHMEQELHYLAYFDGLTQLPNRELFNEQLEHAIDKARRSKTKLAMLYIDVDNFKYINDSFGHTVGDTVLTHVAASLKNSIRGSDSLARIGGDEFVILIEDLQDPVQASKVAKKALIAISSTPEITQFNTSVSIGISLFPEDTISKLDMFRNADTAMYAAKASGKNRYHFYKPELTDSIKEQVQMVNELKRAIMLDEFVIHYQPILRSDDLSVHGVEALIRWQHPERGLLSPYHFISIAEKHGLIGQVTQWMLKNTCLQAKQWLDNNVDIHRISINLSVEDIQVGFHNKIVKLLKDSQFPSKHLQLEITETMLMENQSDIVKELEDIRDLGVTIAIDDFGTGYSSLNQLKSLPVDKLKMDRSFIQDIPHDEDDITLTNMILSMSQHLSLAVVAEGVETQAQANFLISKGCDYLQGYFFAKPMPEKELLEMLSTQQANSDS